MSILRGRHAKMLVTVGPASNSPEILRKLVTAGADAFRLNFSHGGRETHSNVVAEIRKIEVEIDQPLTIVQDLQGPKIRLGMMEKAQILQAGELFTLDSDDTAGDATRCHLPHPEILKVLKNDDKIYINDGLVRLKVIEHKKGKVTCEITSGGTVSSRKGVNLPGIDLPISSITAKDWKDLKVGLELGVDWVAVSFVQRPEDILEIREKVGDKAKIIAKIEMPNAVKRLQAIIEVSDAIMVARGDLGVEMPLEEVPTIQKKIIRKCRDAGKPVIVATQMLESMINHPSPTRAEASDVANATFEGADALMLSAESAAGKYPLEAVAMMDSIIRRVECSSAWQPLMDARHAETDTTVGDAIANAAFYTSEVLDACAIVTFTESGSTALRMARQRPMQPILALTPHIKTARMLGLAWGLYCRMVDEEPQNQEKLAQIAVEKIQQEGLGGEGAHAVLTAGIPFAQQGSTNMLRIITLNGGGEYYKLEYI